MRLRAIIASEKRRALLPSWHNVVLAWYCTILGVRLGWKVAISRDMTALVVVPGAAQRNLHVESAVATPKQHPPRRLVRQIRETTHRASTTQDTKKKDRILYIVTSLSEFDSGSRETTRGYDRFSNTIVPVLRESVTSLLGTGLYTVDVYLIAHYAVTPARHAQLLDALPSTTVGLQIWAEATPTAYELETSTDTLRNHTRGLARQHRYVIKDKFFYYDLFLNWEDDMLIRGEHVKHYQAVTNELYLLRQTAGTTLPNNVDSVKQAVRLFYGPMTQQQLQRTIPGFLRVEVALPNYQVGNENRHEQVPVDYDWIDHQSRRPPNAVVNASICCHVSAESSNPQLPQSPTSDQLYFWETSLEALGIRHMPVSSNLTWVLLLGGNNQVEGWSSRPEFVVGDYWSGRGPHYYFGDSYKRPDRKMGRYGSNQGGWMATRRQVAEWHSLICPGSFLPPYDPKFYRFDGLDMRSVEYWSGGIQLSGIQSCNMQRIMTLDPDGFSRQLLYHTSNNKQRMRRLSGRNINEFWGQLNTIRKNAEQAMQLELEQKQREQPQSE